MRGLVVEKNASRSHCQRQLVGQAREKDHPNGGGDHHEITLVEDPLDANSPQICRRRIHHQSRSAPLLYAW